jgi:hypothetical protein
MHHAPRRFVGQADVANASCTHLIRQCRQGLGNRHGLPLRTGIEELAAEHGHVACRPVQLIQVDVIGIESLEAVAHAARDIGPGKRRQIAAHPRHVVLIARIAGAFRREHHAATERRPFALEPCPDDRFGCAVGFRTRGHRVHFRRIDEVDATLDRVIELRVCLFKRILLPPRHAAEADGRHLQIASAELACRHGICAAFPSREDRRTLFSENR